MPAWLINLVISIAVKFGLPWLLKLFPGLPADIQSIIQTILDEIARHKSDKALVIQNAHAEIKRLCNGPSCPV